jgi:hypothetical protein
MPSTNKIISAWPLVLMLLAAGCPSVPTVAPALYDETPGPPDQPTATAAISSASSKPAPAYHVVLTWVDTRNPAGTTYSVYRVSGKCSEGHSPSIRIASAIQLKTYTDLAVAPGYYCYDVTAVFNRLESAPSATAQAHVVQIGK